MLGIEMLSKAANLPAAGILAVALFGVMSPSATAQTGHTLVNCFEESLGTVHKTLVGDCKGRVVTDEEAAAIHKQRRDYIQKVLSKPIDSKLQDKRLVGLGSGFFVAADGSIITSHHVVDGCTTVSITPTFGELKLATAVVSDAQTDLALLRADIVPPGIASLVPGDGPAVIGTAFIVGYPDMGLVTIEPILTAVDVVGRENNTGRGPAIVIRGDVRRGNSGGPMLDSGGSVIGVVFAKVNTASVHNATGEVLQDIGLALPGDILEAFLESQGVPFRAAQRRPPQTEDRILEDVRPFLAQIGCWQ